MKYCIFCMKETNGNICSHCGKRQDEYIAQPHVLTPGTILKDKYQIGAVLGDGGFGITYIGLDTTLLIRVAIKEFFPVGMVTRSTAFSNEVTAINTEKFAENMKSCKSNFLSEARTLAKFDDEPGIVTVKDCFEENNTAYIVTEYLEGETLKHYLEGVSKISYKNVVTILKPVMKSLKRIHEAGIIHRDISPDNIMISGEYIKLIDFGAAREYLDEKSMSVILKRGYAPFEQYYSKGKQGAWTDIYALCAVMYHCITGEILPESLNRMEGTEILPPSALGIEIDPALEKALLHGLELKSTDRPQSIDELMDEMQIDSLKTVTSNYPSLTRDNKTIDAVSSVEKMYDPNKHRPSEVLSAEEQAVSRHSEETEKKKQEQNKYESDTAKKEITHCDETDIIQNEQVNKKKFPMFVIPAALVALTLIVIVIKSIPPSDSNKIQTDTTLSDISTTKIVTTAANNGASKSNKMETDSSSKNIESATNSSISEIEQQEMDNDYSSEVSEMIFAETDSTIEKYSEKFSVGAKNIDVKDGILIIDFNSIEGKSPNEVFDYLGIDINNVNISPSFYGDEQIYDLETVNDGGISLIFDNNNNDYKLTGIEKVSSSSSESFESLCKAFNENLASELGEELVEYDDYAVASFDRFYFEISIRAGIIFQTYRVNNTPSESIRCDKDGLLIVEDNSIFDMASDELFNYLKIETYRGHWINEDDTYCWRTDNYGDYFFIFDDNKKLKSVVIMNHSNDYDNLVGFAIKKYGNPYAKENKAVTIIQSDQVYFVNIDDNNGLYQKISKV